MYVCMVATIRHMHTLHNLYTYWSGTVTRHHVSIFFIYQPVA